MLTHTPLTFPKGIFKARKATTRIVIHALDTPPNWKFDIREIDRWHREERGWTAIGYHFVIDRPGTIVPGRPADLVGAHCEGWNSTSLSIALAGGKGAQIGDEFLQHYTPEQEDQLLSFLHSALRIWPGAVVVGHRDHPKVKKACPGFDVKSWWSANGR